MSRSKDPYSIPTAPGVYSIWKIHREPKRDENIAMELGEPTYYEECLYVGMTHNLRNRINQHGLLLKYLASQGEMRVRYREAPVDKLAKVESFMITTLKPALNTIGMATGAGVEILTDVDMKKLENP